jgi:hypothetical protein
VQAEVNPHCHGDGQQSENKLPQGKPKKQALLIVSDLLVDTDFQSDHLHRLNFEN